MKLKTIYICSNCGSESPKWVGKCDKCGEWNTFVEDVINVGKNDKSVDRIIVKTQLSTDNFHLEDEIRIKTGINELDRVLGGGFMKDSLVLLVGDPGIGKSTLTIQICDKIAENKKVLYFSGEESVSQISSRIKRLSLKNPISIANVNNLESIIATIESEKPEFIVVDSVQVINTDEVVSQAGSISQIRFVAEKLMQIAKQKSLPILLIGHVNKEGQMAGPQVLTHLVDTVLYLEGDNYHQYRMLRSTKNRFGNVDEVGVFKMEETGLIEVTNPSELFLEGRSENAIGSCIVPVLEGTRVFLVEVQALTSHTNFGYPKRTSSGFDLNRLNIIIAVLNRYANVNLDSSDVYVNIVGGLKLNEPAVDLAVAMAIVSTKLKKPLSQDLVVMGEVGLTGEIRKVSHIEKRLKEAKKLGFKKILCPELGIKSDLEKVEIKKIFSIINNPKIYLDSKNDNDLKLITENKSFDFLKDEPDIY
jgi:DNA repair protein RadA/Sms